MSQRVRTELGRIDAFFPILSTLGNQWAASRPWEGLTIALHLHLTSITAGLVRELVLGGGTWIVSAANPATTDKEVVGFLRGLGVDVHSGGGAEDGIAAAVAASPTLFADVGFALGEGLLAAGVHPRAGLEITRSGVARMRALGDLPFPVLNLNDGQLKPAIENRRGVGEGLWPGFTSVTGMHLSGRRVLIVGYGPVGSGIAAQARALGAAVRVADPDPIRRLVAHYDGFDTPSPEAGLGDAEIVVTASGQANTLDARALSMCADGAILLSAGHGGDELDLDWLRAEAESEEQVGPHVIRYCLPSGHALAVLAGGNPLNIVLNSGSPEPVLLHFALLGLGLEWLARVDCKAGEIPLPLELERAAARAALRAMGRE